MNIDTLEELQETFRIYFDDDELLLERQTSAEDIEEWDSLAQVGLVITIEKKYGIKFSKADIDELDDIGDMVDLINALRTK